MLETPTGTSTSVETPAPRIDSYHGPAVGDAPARRPTGVRLLDAVPELQAGIPAQELELARRTVVVPLFTLAGGAVEEHVVAGALRPFAMAVVDGFVLRKTRLADRIASEALGPGDVLDTVVPDDDPPGTADIVHIADGTATFAVLDDRFRVAARRWPGLHDALHLQRARQARRASRDLAVLHLARVEDRLATVFADLGRRWGRMTPAGVVVDLGLTHQMLGELVGARRPTVTLALADLASAGTVVRRPDRSWLIAPALLGGR